MTTPVSTGFTVNPKLYDFLKWVALTVLPGLVVLITGLGLLVHWDGATVTAGAIALFDTFLGSLLSQSAKNFAKEANFGDLVVGLDEQGNAEVKSVLAARENPVFQVGSKVTMNVVQDHTLPR